MEGRLFAFAFILIIFGFGIAALQSAYWDAGVEGGAATSETETVAVDEGNLTELSNSNDQDAVYGAEENVSVVMGSTSFPARGNWSWNRHNGTIKWNETTAMGDGTSVDVTYTIARPTQEQDAIKDVSAEPTAAVVDEWILVAVVILVLAAAAIAAGRR